MENNNNYDMLTISEVSKLLHILRRWADKGVIKSYSISVRGDRRFIPEDIDRFLNQMNPANR
jgi:DNA-binding transcriptional MerR regulator